MEAKVFFFVALILLGFRDESGSEPKTETQMRPGDFSEQTTLWDSNHILVNLACSQLWGPKCPSTLWNSQQDSSRTSGSHH